MGEAAGDCARTVQRYVRLTYLDPELLDFADQRKVGLAVAEKLSFLSGEEQGWVLKALGGNAVVLSKSQAEALKEESENGGLTEKCIADIIKREVKRISITISAKKIKDYFPQDYTKDQMEEVIFELLESWKERMCQDS